MFECIVSDVCIVIDCVLWVCDVDEWCKLCWCCIYWCVYVFWYVVCEVWLMCVCDVYLWCGVVVCVVFGVL